MNAFLRDVDFNLLVKKPPLLARLFGRKWICTLENVMQWGISYDGAVYVLGEQWSPNGMFLLPSGYKPKHILHTSK